MAILLKRARFRQQPTLPLAVDLNHEIGRSVVEAGYVLGGVQAYSASTQRLLLPGTAGSGTVDQSVTGHGNGISLVRTGTPNYSFINLGRSFSKSTSGGVTMMVRVTVTDLSRIGQLFNSACMHVAQWPGHHLQVNTDGSFFGSYGTTGGTSSANYRRATSATGVVVANKEVTLAAVVRSATDWSLYKDGVLLATPTYAGTGGYNAGTADGAINRREDSTSQISNSWLYLDRALDDGEIQALYEAPFQFLEPRRRRVWALAVASGIPTLSAATAINITDTTATPRVTVTF